MRFKPVKKRSPGLSWASDVDHAKDPNIQPEDAETIFNTYQNSRPAMKRAIFVSLAENPNLPQRLLAALSDDYPEHVAANQAVKLLLLENPNDCISLFSASCLRLLGLEKPRAERQYIDDDDDNGSCENCDEPWFHCSCLNF